MSKYLDTLVRARTALVAQRDAALAGLDEIATAAETRNADAPEFSDEERAAITAHQATVADVKRKLDEDYDGSGQGLDARIAELEAELGRAQYSAKMPNVIVKPEAPTPDAVRSLNRAEARDAAMRSIEAQPDYMVSDENRSHLEKMMVRKTKHFDGDQIARRLLITETDSYRNAWMKAVTQPTPAFTADEARALGEFRAASIGTDSAGGFGVPVLIDPTIILTSGAADAPILRLARIETITTDEWKGVSSTGVVWSTDGEAAAVSDDAPTLAQPTVPVYTGRGFIPYSIEVGMDYPGFAAEMSALLEQGYIDYVVAKTTTGSGSSDWTGIFTALDANTNVEVVVTTDGAFGAVDIDKVWAALPERYRSRATWLMNVDVENEIRAFGSGTATSRFTVDQTAGGISRLNGRPVVLTDYAPTFTGSTGAANILVVGDFSNFLIAQRAGMTVELIPHLFDVTNNRPTGSRGWFAYARGGSDSVNDLGFRLLQNQ